MIGQLYIEGGEPLISRAKEPRQVLRYMKIGPGLHEFSGPFAGLNPQRRRADDMATGGVPFIDVQAPVLWVVWRSMTRLP
jgi:hypothetical protein